MISSEVLGIAVDELLVERWRGWFAPSVQPFRTGRDVSASGSGANCFGTVMAAAGVTDAGGVQIGPERLQAWLDEHTEPITGTGRDVEPGVVFAWTEHGDLAHAPVTIGDGWVLSKPSQSWSSPRLIWTVRETVDSWRLPATRLSRHRILR